MLVLVSKHLYKNKQKYLVACFKIYIQQQALIITVATFIGFEEFLLKFQY